MAALLAAAMIGALVWLIDGPWLRVTEVAADGEHYTATDELADLLETWRGESLLSVDTRGLTERIAALPAVATARVETKLPDRIEAHVAEHAPAFIWQTRLARLLGADDGTLFAALPADGELAADLASLPLIDDRRAASRVMRVGDRVPAGLVDVGLRLLAIEPATLGSAAERLEVRLDDDHGFTLQSPDAGWRIAFGLYGHDPADAASAAAARIERQVTAVRTLFAHEPESGIGWVDARNPGKVYFRAKG